MTEINQLELAISKLSTCDVAWKRPPLEKALLLWGGRVHTWTKEAAATLEKQLRWLDANLDSHNQDKRFAEWQTLLHQYEHGCNVLAIAEGLDRMVAA